MHGLTVEFLKDKPLFKDVADEFLDFIGDAPLVAHNATFDIGFINAELERVSRPLLTADRVVDTLALARRRHPAGPNSLDALCKRYGIDMSQRTKHGALLDSLLLAGVYVELLGERQATLGLNGQGSGGHDHARPCSQGQAASRPASVPPLAGSGNCPSRVRRNTGRRRHLVALSWLNHARAASRVPRVRIAGLGA